MSQPDSAPALLYGLDDRPPFFRACGLGLQHVLTMFGSTVAVPLIFGPLLWPIPDGLPETIQIQLRELQLANTAVLISSVMLCSGVATLLQSTYGSRLPIIQGVSFSFLAAFFAIVETTQAAATIDWGPVQSGEASAATLAPIIEQWQNAGATGMQTIAGAVLIGGVIEAAIGFSGFMGLVRRVLSPVVIGPVIMLIGLALYQFGAPVAAGNWYVSILMMSLIVLFALVLSRHVYILKLFPMLSAILITVGTCYVLGSVGAITSDDPAYVDMSAVQQAEWVRTNTIVCPWGWPTFTGGALVAVLAGYLASMIESFGDYHACKQMAGGGDPTASEISRGIGCEGVGCAVTGLLGGFSSTSYSENIGLVGLTKVGSRYVVQLGAGILILLGLFGKFGAAAAAIPQPVVGGLYCALFGLIAAVGVRQFAKADLSSDRNLFIGGFALFMGLSVPYYFAHDGAEHVNWMPEQVQSLVISVGTTGMAVAAILGLVLDNLIPGTNKERGLE
ncbi:solute carrier family 23 protein [Pirellulales bacterium]|nr:solute carrier family 23 protein [Pirellulales bacterium]